MSSPATLPPATRRTMYFIGVTTGSSSIMKVFPEWSAILGLDAELRGYDAPLHAPPHYYEQIVQHIKADPLVVGALITTHKIDLLEATRAEFDYLDPYALLCGEISSISKLEGRLEGHAKDPISSGLTLENFIPHQHWKQTKADVLCLGSGGAAIAIGVYLCGIPDRPRRFIAIDQSQTRLDALKAIIDQLNADIAFNYICTADPRENDALMAALPDGSLVINATGMGKDRPGSPLSDAARFPQNGYVWELNYRGALDFLHQAKRQQSARNLIVEDGWVYFLHGWSQVVAQVFHLELTPELFRTLDLAASSLRT